MVLGDVELLQLPQGTEGLLVYLRDFVVHQDESLMGGRRGEWALEVKAQLPGSPSPLLSLPPLPPGGRGGGESRSKWPLLHRCLRPRWVGRAQSPEPGDATTA